MIEYSGANDEPIKPELGRKAELEARREVALLAFAGHLAPRAVIDDWNEIAYTCDVCGLWGYTWHPDPRSRHDIGRVDERGGAVFTERCDVAAIFKKFGFFNVDYALATEDRTTYLVVDNEVRVDETGRSQEEIVKKREQGYNWRMKVKEDPERYAAYLAKRREYKRKKREERRAATTTQY